MVAGKEVTLKPYPSRLAYQ